MSKKVLLINPSWNVETKHNMWSKIASCYPSLGLAYIAAVLRENKIYVRILDLHAEQISINQFKSEFLEIIKKYDFIGITATTPLIKNALILAKFIKSVSPSTKIVFGGVHPSVKYVETLSYDCVDYVIRGEGEFSMLELVQGKKPITIKGLSYKLSNGKLKHNLNREPIKDLNKLPMPAYDLLPIRKYRPAIGAYRKLPAMSIFATRGCPGRCTFCFRLFEGTIRYRSAEKIIEEILFLQSFS